MQSWMYREVVFRLAAGWSAEEIDAQFFGVTLEEVVAVRDALMVCGKSVFPDAGHVNDQTQGA